MMNGGPSRGLQQQQHQHQPRQPSHHNVVKIDPALQCDDNYLATTCAMFPKTPQLARKCGVPIGMVLQPLAEDPNGEPVPTVNFGLSGVIRCKRCRTYINPFVDFIDGGRRWKCNMCKTNNDVPNPYFCQLDGAGKRIDVEQRPELIK